MPSGYEPVQNESLGRLDLVKYEVEPSDSTANQTAEVDG
jgi:hypothetical protein